MIFVIFPVNYAMPTHQATSSSAIETKTSQSLNDQNDLTVAESHYTVPPPETSHPGIGTSQVMTTGSLTESTDIPISTTDHNTLPTETRVLAASQTTATESVTETMALGITHAPAATTSGLSRVSSNVSRTEPLFRQTICTLVAVMNSVQTFSSPQPSAGTTVGFANEITAALLDDDLDTCMRPFQLSPLLRLFVDTHDTLGSFLLRIQITGDGLDCAQPSTLVYIDSVIILGMGEFAQGINKRECPFIRSSHSADLRLVTCTYECRPLVPCEGSVHFGILVQRLSWLVQSQFLEQLCDLRAFVWG